MKAVTTLLLWNEQLKFYEGFQIKRTNLFFLPTRTSFYNVGLKSLSFVNFFMKG